MTTNDKAPPGITGGAEDFEAARLSTTNRIIPAKSQHCEPVTVPIPFGYSPNGQYADQQALVLYHLLRWTAATEERRRWGFYTEVHSSTWRKLIGSRYLKALDTLKAAGVVETSNRIVDGRRVESYSTGTETTKPFAKSYRLTDDYRNGKASLYEFRNKRHCRKLRKHHDIDFESLKPWDHWHFENLKALTIDVSAVGSDDQWTVLSASNLLNGWHFFKVCDYQRRHTLLTQLSRRARSALRYGTNHNLVLCDVSACQPLLLGYLVGTAHDHHDTMFKTLKPLNRKRIPKDVLRWIKLCESREIYSYLHRAVLESGESLKLVKFSATKQRHFAIDYSTMTASGFKRSCLIPLFDRVTEMEKSPVFKVIVSEFPTVATYLRKVKTKHHATAASLCQRLESRLLQQGAMRELHEKHSNELSATIHDAILTTKENGERVQGTIREQFRELNTNPTIKQESTNPPTED